MKLRTRLIVVFTLLSVVPLGAITFYSYTSNVRALREAAAHEADLLAAELGQRMQLVTDRLTERVVRLLDLPAPPTAASPSKPARPGTPAVPAEIADAAVESGLLNDQIADALGEAAILLNNVELPDRRPGRGREGRPPGRPGEPSRGRRGIPGDGPFPPPVPRPPAPAPPADAPRPPDRLGPGPAGEAPPASAGERVTIDLEPIRRNLYRELVPMGRGEGLTPEDRRRVAAEINQRMLDIVAGIKVSATELRRRADEARAKAEADAKATAETAAKAAQPTKPATAPIKEATAVRKSAFSGSRLDVTSERNGQVSLVKAELNLSNVLMTVFSTMGREKGEVPFAIDKDGRVYTPTDEDGQRIAALGRIAQDNALGTTILPQWIVVTTADPTGSGLRFGIARPVGESLASLRRAAGQTVALGLLFIGVAIIAIVPLASGLTRDLTKLTGGAGRIARGDYGARVTVKARDEIGELARAFNQMAEDVEQHQRAIVSQERLKRELELGREIQHDMLPQQPLQHGLTEIQGVSVPAREVGGDFFNYFMLPSDRIALVVGDVSGKGVGAALLMANVQASLRLRLTLGQDLAAIAAEIDADIDRNAPGQMYATLFLGILNPATHQLDYVNAGHHPQFVLRRQGGLEPMSSTGLPVGLLAGRGYQQVRTAVAAGDFLFFYTDGCVETLNDAGDPFGAERLEQLLLATGSAGPNDVLQRVENALQQFRGSSELFDDATMMAVRVG